MELVALLHVLEIELKTKDHRVNSVAELGTARKSLGAGARICTPLALRKDPGIPNARETNHTGGIVTHRHPPDPAAYSIRRWAAPMSDPNQSWGRPRSVRPNSNRAATCVEC
ncbi:hypothetical protein N7533_006202 [Penicillium manginii]|uniref:uncharacterized protein n=1 Tax=Penicillium manginii TaxID=203109 RepID=UPI00254871B5|nr:uncharacterized protein N7533_006202 [Penicillium manginii]KAJ5756659.1 hypothetical protein N7533_006202 [Penicillium manginii]